MNNEYPQRLPIWRRHWLLGFFLVAVTIIAFLPAWHAGFIWDDDQYVTDNPLLTASDGLRRIWFSLDSPSQYFPLTYTTFYMERPLWGLNPMGYHWVNLLLHAANALLVWRVLARLHLPGAWLAAAIFALHPVQVESVAWITERKNVLMGFFFLLSLCAWLKFIEDQRKDPWRYYILALVLYALALFAKTTACTLPAALLLILWLERRPIHWRRLGQVAPFVMMGIGMGMLTVWWEHVHQGTPGKIFEIRPVERVLIASRGLWFYLGKLFWPVHLTFSYPRWTISASNPVAYVWVLATTALGMVIWRVRPWAGRSVEVAAVFFAVTLSPVLGFIMLYTFRYSFVADHYQYLACIGPIALAAAGMKMGLGRIAAGKPFIQPALYAGLLMTLGILTWKQCRMYVSAETLWQTTIQLNPNSWFAQGNLGATLGLDGKVDEAIPHFQKALQINPDYAEACYNLGLALDQKGRVDEAIPLFQKVLTINSNDANACYNLGLALGQKGNIDEAISNFQKALQINPSQADAHYYLGSAYIFKGKTSQGIAELKAAIHWKPDNLPAQRKLAGELLKTGKAAEAIPYCEAVVKAKPEEAHAHFTLGWAYQSDKQPEQALTNYKEAVRLAPDAPQCLNALAWIYATSPKAELRNGTEAVRLATRACEITQRHNTQLLDTMAAAYAETGRFDEAIKTTGEIRALAVSAHDTNTADMAQQRLDLYKAGKPYRDEQ